MTARPGPHDLASGTIVGGYRVNRLLGVGGMGVVYRATQLSLQRDVALKVLASRLAADDDSRLRFLQEGQLAARVSHPHLVHVLDVGESHQGMFIAFELVEGETLKQRIDREGALVAPFAIEVVVTCADVLSTLHESGILHRDLKPANIFITPDRGALLADLGIARDLVGSKVKTQAGLLLGTPGYMAPELIHGEPPSRSSDLYALAIVFYECLAGSPPFDDQDTWAVFKSHINDPVPSMRRFRPDLSPAFDGFFARALAKSPVDRYQGAVLFAEAVRGLPQEIRSRQLDRVGRATQDVTLSNIAVRAAGETLARPGRPPAPLWHVAGQLGRGRLWIAVSSCIVAMTLIAGLVWWRAARLGPPAQRPGPALLHPPAPVLDLSAPPPVEDDPDGKARIDALAVKARERLAAVVTEARRLSEDSRRDRRRPSRSSVARQMAAVWAKGLRDCRGHLIELGQRFGSANDARAAIEAGRLLGEIFRVWRTCEHCLDRFLDSPDGLPGSSDADGADAVLATDVYLAAAAAVAEETRRILPKALEPCRQPEWLTGRGALLGIIASAASDPSLTERRRKEMRTLFAEALPHLVARDQAPAPDPRMVELPFLALRSAGANGACASLAAGVLRELARLGDLSPRETVMAFYAWSQLAHLGRKETALSEWRELRDWLGRSWPHDPTGKRAGGAEAPGEARTLDPLVAEALVECAREIEQQGRAPESPTGPRLPAARGWRPLPLPSRFR